MGHGDGKRILWGAGTTRTFRAHWALHEVAIEYESRPIGSRTGETKTEEFTRLNPRQKIPVLQDGDLTLAESAAIVTYLGETYGDDLGLVPPSGSPERAHYYEWCFWVMTELDAHTLYVIRKHSDLHALYGEAPNAVRAAREGFRSQLRTAERAIGEGGPYLIGGTFTGADLLLANCLDWARFIEIPIGKTLDDYRDRIAERPAYRSAAALNYASRK